ncbi:MAG TPA: FkbM family methyltransferase [Polyangia bacterium]|nr:FkbM family methyltransferase [Polyangia bacterium]
MSLLRVLDRIPGIHFAINQLHMRRVINAALGWFPIVRTLPQSGVRYRWRYLDSIPLAEELFGQKVYDGAISPGLETFADLGCNVGHYIALLADRTGRRDLRGLAIDADPDMVKETEWVIAANGLSEVVPVCGLVARPGAAGERDFYLHPCKIKSSLYAVDEPGQPDKGPWTKTRVREVDVEALWRARFGAQRCHLLKVDIEGAEADFLTEDNPFLERVDTIVLEIHKWVVSPDTIDRRLRNLGFRKTAALRDSPTLEIASYARA